MAPGLIDISRPIVPGMPRWPGDPPVEIRHFLDFPTHGLRASSMSFSLHTGTHVDAPLHHLRAGGDVESLRLQALIGPAQVIDVGDVDRVTADVLERHAGVAKPERILVRTANSRTATATVGFDPDFVAFTRDAAQWVVDRGIVLVGVDNLSVQSFHDPAPDVHVILLEAGVVILEGLDLSGVDVSSRYELLCLPLRVPGAEGSPCRAVLRGIP